MNIYMAGESCEAAEVREKLIKESDVVLLFERYDAEALADCAAALAHQKYLAVACNKERPPTLLLSLARVILCKINDRDQAIFLTEKCTDALACTTSLTLFVDDSDRLQSLLLSTESPLEALLAIYLDQFGIDFVTQHDVEVEGHRYRLDFAIPKKMVVVEVDGHEFHDRTKEQARRDKSRDRLLQLRGWRVLRFTGSEIFQTPISCAHEVKKHLTPSEP